MTQDNLEKAFAGAIDFQSLVEDEPIASAAERTLRQIQLRDLMAESLYGAIPALPDNVHVSRQSIAGEKAEHLTIKIPVAGRQFEVDAVLWLPPDLDEPCPLICGLDFVGPVGLLNSPDIPIDPNARISSRPVYGAHDNRITETLRGVSAYRWPLSMMLNAGYAVLVSCYGSWVPDDPTKWKTHGLYPLLDCQNDTPTGAISLWAWAIHRLLDVAATISEIDESRVAVAGHSRLGKAALWAAANDSRIGAVFASNSGCAGSAPAAHPVGETLAQMAERFPHWTIAHDDRQLAKLPIDQHHLLSQIAPRAVYLAHAKEDLWADPIGSYLALQKAAEFWIPSRTTDWKWPLPQEIWRSFGRVTNGPVGFHLRPGGHNILPYDWQHFLNFLETQERTGGV